MTFDSKKIRYGLLIFMVWCKLTGYCQATPQDSIFSQFEECMKQNLQKKYEIADTNFACFYGDEYNYYMEMSQKGEGRYYSLKAQKCADSLGGRSINSNPLFYRGMTFLEFINFIITQTPNANCVFPSQKGIWVFVNAPVELWQQFYLDKLAYKDSFYLTPTIDIIQADGMNVRHKRKILVLEYIQGKGFGVKKEIDIRDAIICPKKK